MSEAHVLVESQNGFHDNGNAPPSLSVAESVLSEMSLDTEQLQRIVELVPGGSTNIEAIFPLAPLQTVMLFDLLLRDHASDPYVVPTLLAVSRDKLPAVIEAFQTVVDRHPVLRSAVFWDDLPQPVHVVYRQATLRVEEIQIDPTRDAVEQLKKRLSAPWAEMDLRNAPLVRLDVVQEVNSERCLAYLHLHHLIADHESWKAILTEAAACLNDEFERLPASIPYQEYALQAHAQAKAEAAHEFFRGKFGDITEPTVPFGVGKVHGGGGRIVEARCELDSALAQRIRNLARHSGVSAARVFHAAWGLVIAHTSARDDVVFGTVLMTVRHRSARAQRIGLFVNTLPLRLQLSDASATDLIGQVQQGLAEILRYKHSPLTLAQHSSQVASGAPLFTSLLNYRHSERESAAEQIHAKGIEVLLKGEAWTTYPVEMSVDDLGDGFGLLARTDQQIDPNRMVGLLRTAVQSLTEALELAPQTPALALQVLPEDERQQVVERFNATEAPFSQAKLVHELFEEQVARAPAAIALEYEGRSLTYAELNKRSNQLARYLRSVGVCPDQLVGLCVERSFEMVIGLMGILKSGAAYVPIDPSYPPSRLEYMLKDAAPRVLLTQEHLRASLSETGTQLITLDGDWSLITAYEEGNLERYPLGMNSRNLAYVIYTSGSTGMPKGAMNEHRAVINRLEWMQSAYRLNHTDRVLQKTPFSFDVSVWEFFWTLMTGARLVIARPGGHQDPEYLRTLIESSAVTTLHFVPSMLQVFLDQHRPGCCQSIRHVVCSGEELPASLQRKFCECLPHARLSNLYGPTEAAVDVTVWECRREDMGNRVPIGRPISNIQMYVLNPHRVPMPVGVAGEIYIGGVGVGRGYLNRPELTAERFVRDIFSKDPAARLYKTGDMGRWRPDGAIEYLGRNDHQVKIRGLRIELGEIEAQLLRDTRVKEAVVIAREDVPGEKQLVAYMVVSEAAPAIEELRTRLKAVLPEYMVPSAFVTLERMPLSANGKLDRRALPAPQLNAFSSRQYEPPQGEVEQLLAGIWQSLLPVARIGRHDSFFELGGHSLSIVQMLERLRRVGLSVEVRRVFENPTLADLAAVLSREVVERADVPENRIPSDSKVITPQMLSMVELEPQHIELIANAVPGGAANIQDIYPLAPLQEGILFHHLLNERAGDTYVIPVVLRVNSRKRLEELIGAIQALVDRHDILRTAVLWDQLPQPVQVVHRRARLVVEEAVLKSEPAAQINEWLKLERQQMDLREAPLMRLQVAADPQSDQWYVLWQFHHIVDDATSWKIMTAEIVAQLTGEARQLPDSIPYRNHVAQSLAYARTGDAENFFRRKLADIDEPIAAFGLLEVHGSDRVIEEVRQEIDLELARRIRIQAGRLGVSAATVFHAAWALVIAKTSGREDAVFGSVLLGRMLGGDETQRILGMFINTLPLRLPLRGISAKELVTRTQRELVELLSHEQASLAVAQRCSGISGTTPLFNALLNYRHDSGTIESCFAGAEGVQMLAYRAGTNYPITLSVDDLTDGFALTAQTDQRVDPHRVVAYLQAAMQALVAALEQAPQALALALPVLPVSERREVIERFNATRAPYPREKLIHELFEEQVRRTPQAIAVKHGRHALTYDELNTKANRLARYLRGKGIGPDQLVGLCAARSPEMAIGLLGILKAGGAYLPLDPNYPRERLQHMLEDSSPALILTQRELQPVLPVTAADVLLLDQVLRETAGVRSDNLFGAERTSNSEHLLYVIYTSGSTGKPKGTGMPHRAMVNLLEWHRQELPLREGQRVLQFAALSFDVAFQEIFSTLCLGGTLVLLDEWVRKDARALTQLLSDESVERLFAPPLMLQSLAEYFNATSITATGLKDIIVAGEQLRVSPEIVGLFTHLDACRLHNHYGPTETHVVTALTLTGNPSAWPALPTIGKPIANTQIYILDTQLQPIPLGVAGEIYVAGANVARGYLHRPELTAERFVRDPFSENPQARMYKTGDLARWGTDGTIEYLGRNDDQVKIRGFRVELGEIESRLALHQQVKEAAVVAREDAPGDKRLVAYVTPRQAEMPSAEALRAHLKAELPEHMVPSAFVVLERLPLTPSGKLNRRALPAPGADAYASEKYEAPHGEVEHTLAGLWQELLSVNRVGRGDSFFELGGHSLLVLKSLFKINQAFGSNLKVTDVYKSPTLRELAARISGAAITDDLVNLAKESSLDVAIVPNTAAAPCVPARAILLTGATGFVGRFLLAQLLEDTRAILYCLVRATSRADAAARVRNNLAKWDLWREAFESRIVAIPGDLRLPRLGLDEAAYRELCLSVDSIYHCGTSMNHLETYEMAKPANVGAAVELLKIATTGRPKLINYLSTLGIFSPTATKTARVVDEDSSIDHENHPNSQGYVASKWVGEKIFMNASARGIPCNIFRLGLVWADTQAGRYDELQRVYRIIKSSLLSGTGVENYHHYEMPPVPVDYVARAIVLLASKHNHGGGIFHIASNDRMSEGIFERCNEIADTALQLLPYYEWIGEIKRLHQEGSSLPAVPLVEFAFSVDAATFYEDRTRFMENLRIDSLRTQREIERAGLLMPALDDELVRATLESMLSRDLELREWAESRSESMPGMQPRRDDDIDRYRRALS